MALLKRNWNVLVTIPMMIALILALAALPASADSITRNGITLSFPDDYESCAPADTLTTTGIDAGWTVQYFLAQVLPDNTQIPLGSGTTMGNLNLSFPYPAVDSWPTNAAGEREITVGAVVSVVNEAGLQKVVLSAKWTVTCPAAAPSETPTNTPEPTNTPTSTPTDTPTNTPTKTPEPTFTPTPARGAQGCTPGYWKQDHHYDSWQGYAPGDSFNAVFGVNASFGSLTLGQAVGLNGGGERAMARHAVAALLNSSSSGVDYYFTTAEVIAAVQQAYATGDFEGVKNSFERENERGCPLN
jgi:hypothetical protein